MQTTVDDTQSIAAILEICRRRGFSESDIAAAHLNKGPLYFNLTHRGLFITPATNLKALFDYDPDEDDVVWDDTDERDLVWPNL